MIIIPGGDQFMANVCGRPCVPRSRGDPCGLGQDVVAAIGDVSEFLDRFVEVAALLARAVRRLLDRDWRAPDMAIERAEISLSFLGPISAAPRSRWPGSPTRNWEFRSAGLSMMSATDPNL
jgi:hypothetical protein